LAKEVRSRYSSIDVAIIPWILRVRLQVASAFFPLIIGKGGQIKVQLIDCSHHTMDIQGEAAGGLSILPSDYWQRRSDQGIVIDTGHHTMDTQGEATGGLTFLPSDHWQRRSDQGTVIDTCHHRWIFRVRLQVASVFFPQIIGKGGQINVQSLILAIIPWIFRVRLQVASAFFPKIIGKGSQIKVQLH
jgi:cell division FtsZ-interacting protein ZapD